MGDELMNTEALADLLGVPVGTIYQWRYHGRGPRAIRVGRALRFRRSDVESWLEEHTDPVPATG